MEGYCFRIENGMESEAESMTKVGIVNSNMAVDVLKVTNPRKFAEQFLKEKELKAEMLKNMPKKVQFIDKMKSFQGEVPNILINALGTGLIAPVFIKYNFMSKTDEDTRTYTAWRQPVSAVLAVLTQAGLVIPFNKLVNNMTGKGKFEDLKFNESAFQSKDFHKAQIKKENPKLSKIEVEKLVEQRQLKQLEDMVEDLYNKDTIHVTSAKKGRIELGEEKIKELLEQTTGDMLKKAKNDEAAQKIILDMQQAIKDKKSIKEIHAISTGLKDSNFVYDVAQKHVSNISNNIKGKKQFIGIIVSLAILPLTCSLLNFVYPKFMDAFFPKLSNKKQKPKHDDTFVKSGTQAVQKGGA